MATTDEIMHYAQERADATGKKYLVSEMFHVLVARKENRMLAEKELGGIRHIVCPDPERK